MAVRGARTTPSGLAVTAIAALAGLTLGVGGVAAATSSTPERIRACAAKPDGALRVIGNNAHCRNKEDALHWNVVGPRGVRGPRGLRGPQGPSGVVSVVTLNATGGDAVTGATPVFLGDTTPLTVINRRTTATVSGTIDVGTEDGAQVELRLGVCVQEPSHDAHMTAYVEPNVTMPIDDYIAQSVTGAVGNLPPGTYTVGLCSSHETANTIHGFGYAVVTVMQSATRTMPVAPGDPSTPFGVTQR